MSTILQKLNNLESVNVVTKAGTHFTIVPFQSYGLTWYSIIQDGHIVRKGFLLDKATLTDWCDQLQEEA